MWGRGKVETGQFVTFGGTQNQQLSDCARTQICFWQNPRDTFLIGYDS